MVYSGKQNQKTTMVTTPLINVGQGMKVLLGIWGDELNRSSLHFVAIDSQLSPPSVSEVDCYLAHRSRVSRVSTLLVATIQGCEIGQKSYFGFYSSGLLPGTEEQGQLGFNSAGRHNSVTRAVNSGQKVF